MDKSIIRHKVCKQFMAIRYAKTAMTIDGIVFNPGDIVPESLYPALDAQEKNMKEATPAPISNDSFPGANTDADEEEEDDEEDETYEIEVPLSGSEADSSLPKPELDSTVTPSAAAPKVETPKADAPKSEGKKAGK